MGYGVSTPESSGELRLLDTLPQLNVIIDAGANRGAWAVEARKRWPSASIHAFEPAADTFDLLTAAVGDTVTCRRAALGDTPRTMTLHKVPGIDALASLHQRDIAEHNLAMTDTETVDAVTLDGYCVDNNIDRIDFLKLDVEGHELAVLAGASRLLAEGRIARIQFEFGGCNIDSRTYLRDFVRLLSPDYRLSRITRDGLEPFRYSEAAEVFVTMNFYAERDAG